MGHYRDMFSYVFILCPTWKRNQTYQERSWLWNGRHVGRFFFIDPGERLHALLRALFDLCADTPTLYLIDMSASKALTKKKKDMLSELAFSGRHAKQSIWVLVQKYIQSARTCASRRSGLPYFTARTATPSRTHSTRTTSCHTNYVLPFTLA